MDASESNDASGSTASPQRTPIFSVRPSSVLKLSVMARLKGNGDAHQGLKHRLAADIYRLQQLCKTQKISQHRVTAEGQLAEKQYIETVILSAAADKGKQWTALDPPLALGLADAAREALLAEEEVVRLKVQEYEMELDALRDQQKEIHARVVDATEQASAVSNILKQYGILVDPQSIKVVILPLDITPPPREDVEDFYSDPYTSSEGGDSDDNSDDIDDI